MQRTAVQRIRDVAIIVQAVGMTGVYVAVIVLVIILYQPLRTSLRAVATATTAVAATAETVRTTVDDIAGQMSAAAGEVGASLTGAADD